MAKTDWTEIILSAEDAEERSFHLFELGALGVEVITKSKVRAFFQAPKEDLSAELRACGFSIESQQQVANKNWTGECPEMWTPIRAGSLTITPVEGTEACEGKRPKKNEIFIIPGLGFGTGHHTATQHILHLLHAVPPDGIRNALDVGTGSGILAISLEKLFQVPITAVDTDPLALENAADNIKINGCTNINLIEGSLEKVEGRYDLIVANLYAELLIKLASELEAKLAPRGTLALSGIVESMRREVEAAFTLTPKLRRIKDGWVSLLFTN